MTRALLIITAEHLPSARALAEAAPFSLPPEEAARLFVPAGSTDGHEPATHHWASGVFTAEQTAALTQLSTALPWAQMHVYDLATEPQKPLEILAALGLQPMIAAGLLAESNVN
jgi:hypothetical protein